MVTTATRQDLEGIYYLESNGSMYSQAEYAGAKREIKAKSIFAKYFTLHFLSSPYNEHTLKHKQEGVRG